MRMRILLTDLVPLLAKGGGFRKFRMLFVAAAVLGIAAVGFATPSAIGLYYIAGDPLVYPCGDTNLIPMDADFCVYIMQGAEPADTDPLVPVGTGVDLWNYDCADIDPYWFYGGGYIYAGQDLTCDLSTTLTLYLRVSHGTAVWTSQTFVVNPGDNIYPTLGPWTCTTGGGGCETPSNPYSLSASEDQCDSVYLEWIQRDTLNVDAFAVFKGTVAIDTVEDTDDTLYTYSVYETTNARFEYKVKALNYCPDDTAASSATADWGRQHYPPIQPTNVSATDDECDQVTISFDLVGHTEIDSVFLWRDDAIVMRLDSAIDLGGAPFEIVHIGATVRDSAIYKVQTWSELCDTSDVSAGDEGMADGDPPQVQNVRASTDSCQIIVRWTDVDYNDGYYVYVDDATAGTITEPDDSSWIHSAAAVGITYHYKVQAWNDNCGQGPNSAETTGYRIATPNVTPSGLTASDDNCDAIVLMWTDETTGGYQEDGFVIMRNGAEIDTTDPDAETYTDTGAAEGVAYNYQVYAYNICGNGTATASVPGRRLTIPGQVQDVDASDGTDCFTVFVTWTDLNDWEDGYKILRETVTLDAETLETVGADVTSYNDSTAAPGTAYNYSVMAYNACGNGPESGSDQGSKAAIPDAVQNVEATDDSCEFVRITWDDLGGDEVGYDVIRDDGLLRTIDTVATTGADETTYDDDSAVPGTPYTYTVKAFNICGSGPGGSDAGLRKAVPAQVTGVITEEQCQQVRFDWDVVAEADSYCVIRLDMGVIDCTTDTFLIFNPGDVMMHDYKVVAYNECGSGDSSGTVSVRAINSVAEPNFAEASTDSCDAVYVTWSDDSEFEDGYIILRDYTDYDTTAANDTVYADTGAVPGVNYAYTVQGYNAVCGRGGQATVGGMRKTVPDSVETVAATDDSCGFVRVSWDPLEENVDGYRILRDDGVVLTVETVGTAGAEDSTYDDFTATAGQVYQYSVVPFNDCGDGPESASEAGSMRPLPAQVTSLADSAGCDSIYLTWAVAADADSYCVFVDDVSVDCTANTAFTYGPDDYDEHDYRVVAYNTCGSGVSSETVSSTALTVPGVPADFALVDGNCDRITLSWTSPLTADSIIIVRDEVELARVAATETEYIDSLLAANDYEYYIAALNVCGSSDTTLHLTGTVLPFPTAPATVVATDTSCNAVYLFWDPSTGTFDEYIIYEDSVEVARVTAPDTSYTHVPDPGTYDYQVSANGICGESEYSAVDEGTRLPGPTPPTDVAASDEGCDSILVTWTASTGTFSEYHVYRDAVVIDTVAEGTEEYVDYPEQGTYTYTVRAWSFECGPTVHSDPDDGTRLPQMTVVTGLAATTDDCDEIMLNWNPVAGAEVYFIYRIGDVNPYATVNAPDTSWADDTVNPGDTHDYYVTASNPCNESTESDTVTGMRRDVPAVVLNLAASDTSCTAVYLVWDDVADETGYIIRRDNAGARELTEIDTVEADITSYTDDVEAGTYEYTVHAYNECGNGTASEVQEGTRIAEVGMVADLAATTDDCDEIVVTWTDSGDETGYNLYRDDALLIALGADVAEYTDAPDPGDYEYKIAAVNECGEGTLSDPVTGSRLTVPDQVMDLTTDGDCDSVWLIWSDVATETGYEIYRGPALIHTNDAGDTTYTDIPGPGTYAYAIIAINTCGPGTASESVDGTQYDVLGQVTGLAATDDACEAVTLTWDNITGESGYVIYRDSDSLTTVAADVTTYDDVPDPGTYSYTVAATNPCGIGAQSDPDNGTRLPGVGQVQNLTASDMNCDAIVLNWDNLDEEFGFVIYRDDVVIDTVETDITSFTDSEVPADDTTTYQVAAYNVCGEGLKSDPATGYRPIIPAQVTGLAATNSCDNVVLIWLDLFNEDKFYIYRDAVLLDSTNADDTTFTDAADAGCYDYTVMASNHCGDGPPSEAVEGCRLGVPPQVTGVVASTEFCDEIIIGWEDAEFAAEYIIWRGVDAIDTVDAQLETSYVDTPAVGQYDYMVQAINECGDGSQSAAATGVRRGPPATPGDLTVEEECGVVTISWGNVDDELGYVIQRDGSTVDSTETDVTTTTDSPGAAGTYTYTVYAYNDCGDSDPTAGEDVVVPPPLAQVQNLTASVEYCDSVLLAWDDVDNEDGYYLFRDFEDTPFDTVEADVTSATDISPDPGSHDYTVAAFNTCGLGPESDAATGVARTYPNQVTGLTASDTSCVMIVLEWNDVDEEDGYYLYRDGAWTPIATLDPDETYYEDVPESPGEHWYVVAAFNDCGDGVTSDQATGVQLAVPDTVQNVQASSNSCDYITVTWDDLLDEDEYHILRDGFIIATVEADVVEYCDSAETGTHDYAVRGSNVCGDGEFSVPPAQGEVLEWPGMPQNLTATDDLCEQADLDWDAATGDVDGYNVYDEDTGFLGSTPADQTDFSVTDCIAGEHTYWVTAFSNECGEGIPGNPAVGFCHGDAGIATGLTASTDECDQITLDWTAATGEVEEYRIYRDAVQAGTSLIVGWVDAGVDDIDDHVYYVTAWNQYCGEDDPSETATGNTRFMTIITTDLADTMQGGQMYTLDLDHCDGVQRDSVYLIVPGEPDRIINVFDPPQDQIVVGLPTDLAPGTYDGATFKIISVRDTRADEYISEPFVFVVPVSVDDPFNGIPTEFALNQNFPNPFNPSTSIRFGVPKDAHVTLEVFDILGRCVTTLVDRRMEPGWHVINFNCAECASGMYLVRMHTADKTMLRKMVLMK